MIICGCGLHWIAAGADPYDAHRQWITDAKIEADGEICCCDSSRIGDVEEAT